MSSFVENRRFKKQANPRSDTARCTFKTNRAVAKILHIFTLDIIITLGEGIQQQSEYPITDFPSSERSQE